MSIQKACPTCSSPGHKGCCTVAGVHIVVTPVLQPDQRPCFDPLDTDVLVLSLLDHNAPADLSWALNGELEKIVQAVIVAQGFVPTAGNRVLINTRDAGYSGSDIRWIMLVGLGDARHFGRREACSLFGLAMHDAAVVDARKITIPVIPYRQTSDSINLKGTAAVLRCRVSNQMAASGAKRMRLKEIELIMTPQAGRQILRGLAVTRQLCATCTLPEFPDELPD